MKMMSEDMLEPFDEEFMDPTIENNYYARGLSPYIRGVYEDLSIGGEPLSKYAAGYMWGTLGIVYNPEYISEEEAYRIYTLLNRSVQLSYTVENHLRQGIEVVTCYDDEYPQRLKRRIVGKDMGDLPERVKLSSDTADIEGGLVLRRGSVEINNSVEAIFSYLRPRLEAEVAKILFP